MKEREREMGKTDIDIDRRAGGMGGTKGELCRGKPREILASSGHEAKT